MKNLKILWNNRSTWRNAFDYWYILMFPHLYYSSRGGLHYNEPDLRDDAWWFYEALNNFDNLFDEDYE
jgi:hypothetical protein